MIKLALALALALLLASTAAQARWVAHRGYALVPHTAWTWRPDRVYRAAPMTRAQMRFRLCRLREPVPRVFSNEDARRYYECALATGVRPLR